MNPKILDTIGSLDESIIHEAEETAAEKYFAHKKRNHYMRLISVAACFVICFCLCLPILLSGLANSDAPDGREGDPSISSEGIGGGFSNQCGTVTFEESTDETVTLLFEKNSNDSFYVLFTGYKQGADGVRSDFYACTDLSYQGNGINCNASLKITINGESAEDLPIEAGYYKIIIDFSDLLREDFVLYPEFTVSGMGKFDRSTVSKNSTFQNLSVYDYACFANTVVLCLQIDKWVQNADSYVQKLYFYGEDIVGASAFGRELAKVWFEEKEYYVLDTTSPNSNYKLDIYITIEYAANTFRGTKLRSMKLDAFLNGTSRENFGSLRFLYNAENVSEPLLVLSDLQELTQYGEFWIPSVFPCEATLVNQVLWYPQTETFSLDYKAEEVRWPEYGISVFVTKEKGFYGEQNKESFSWEGMNYTIYYSESGSKYPPIYIAYEYKDLYYQVSVDIQREFDVKEFIKGFSLLKDNG